MANSWSRRGILAERGWSLAFSLLLIPAILGTNLIYDGVPGASNGNLKNDGTRIYKSDALNRLLEVDRVSGPVRNLVSASGRW